MDWIGVVDCGHLIEIYDFSPELKTCDLLAAFIEFKYVNTFILFICPFVDSLIYLFIGLFICQLIDICIFISLFVIYNYLSTD